MLVLTDNLDELFKQTELYYKDILSVYESNKEVLHSLKGPWTFVPLWDVLKVMPDQISHFKSINENISQVGNNTLMAVGLSSILREDGVSPHADNHPKDGRFKRFHLALQLTPTSKIHVTDDNGNSDVYEWELGKWMEFDGVKYQHYPENLDDTPRIVLIIDVFVGDVSDEDLLDYYIEIEKLGWINKLDFRPNYNEYIATKGYSTDIMYSKFLETNDQKLERENEGHDNQNPI